MSAAVDTGRPAAALTWLRRDAYYLESFCKRYTVSRALSKKVVTYQAWRRGQPMAELLGTFLSEVDAKACASAHAEGAR